MTDVLEGRGAVADAFLDPGRPGGPDSLPADAARAGLAFDRPGRSDAPALGLPQIMDQVRHDLFGTKDVQNAITASYVWMADQIGHVAIGLVPTLLACWIADCVMAWLGLPGFWRIIVFAVLTGLWFAVWVWKEREDFEKTRRRAGKEFKFNAGDIRWNVKTALLYIGIGGLLGAAPFVGWTVGDWISSANWHQPLVAFLILLGVTAVALWPAFHVACWWLRRKLAFQQAGLPYLYRLANFTAEIEDPDADAVIHVCNFEDRQVSLRTVLFGPDVVPPNTPPVRHLLIVGPPKAGKTSLAVGIGTEFAFALGVCRYLPLVKLAQLAAHQESRSPSTGMEYDDGRVLWPWTDSDLLIVDDADIGVTVRDEKGAKPITLVKPERFAEKMKMTKDDLHPFAWLGSRRSVWVLGNEDRVGRWQRVIADLMGIDPCEIRIIRLKTPQP